MLRTPTAGFTGLFVSLSTFLVIGSKSSAAHGTVLFFALAVACGAHRAAFSRFQPWQQHQLKQHGQNHQLLAGAFLALLLLANTC